MIISCTATQTIYITSNPSGAGVWTDKGRYVGSTPLSYKEKKLPVFYLFKKADYDYKRIITKHNQTSYHAVLDREIDKSSHSISPKESNTYAKDSYESTKKGAKAFGTEKSYSTSETTPSIKSKPKKKKSNIGRSSANKIPILKKTK